MTNGIGRVGWRGASLTNIVPSLLDTYSGAAVAYSLRKLRSAYTGHAIRVRRSSDNTSQDIGFDSNGNLDTNALLDFVGYKNDFVGGSETLSTNTAFQGTGLTITGNWLTGPDGVTPGNKLQETATYNYHRSTYSILSGNNSTIGINNFSGYLKKGTGSNAPDRIAVGFGNTTYHVYGIFNLTTGVIETQYSTGTVTDVEILMTSVGNGWYCCSVGGNLNVATNQSISISFCFVNDNPSFNPFTTWHVGNVNSDVQITQVQWVRGLTSLQRYSKTLTSGGGVGGNGFVTIFYDQSTTSNNMVQTTAINQGQIVNNGALITRNSKPYIQFSSTQYFTLATILIMNTTSYSMWLTYEKSATGNQAIILTNGSNYLYLDYNNGGTQHLGTVGPVIQNTSPALAINTTYVVNGIAIKLNTGGNNLSSSFYTNGGLRGASTPGNNVVGSNYASSGYFPAPSFRTATITTSEWIIWKSDQTANRTTIESNINSYWGIY